MHKAPELSAGSALGQEGYEGEADSRTGAVRPVLQGLTSEH